MPFEVLFHCELNFAKNLIFLCILWQATRQRQKSPRKFKPDFKPEHNVDLNQNSISEKKPQIMQAARTVAQCGNRSRRNRTFRISIEKELFENKYKLEH